MRYWERVKTLGDKYQRLPAVTSQLTPLTSARDAIIARRLPEHQLPRLGLDITTIAMAGTVPNGKIEELVALDHLLGNFRWYLAYHYGVWAYITQDLITKWMGLYPNRRYLEVAAGNGLLSYGFRSAGAKVISTDALTWVSENGTGKTPWTKVEAATATSALWEYGNQVDAVIMAWSPDRDPSDAHLLQTIRTHFPQLELFVIGDRFGITNSNLFWREARMVPDKKLLQLNQAFRKFDQVGDHIYLMH
ncbi:SAM-dependent methyltransferase [Lacticaseibacillus hulanensis]|uniref:SAM-dependent methyltransferase n=1 Tax=Lacticaseibacillus hulanensis TaxID=2493111 RepID=UPI000FD85321|nr:SAM-dependent methyltransferase [Lacticaseibacillus hulanensis]